jgi:pantetheine-phosphate adenylyltransferase
MKSFGKVAVGGTFDELHKGHRILLSKSFEIGDRVLIGLCSDKFVKKLGKPHVTATYEERLAELKAFLAKAGVLGISEIISLEDPYGPTITDTSIEALVVSKETEQSASRINRKRTRIGLEPLSIVAIDMVPSENCAPISTTKIRRGEIDREGRLKRKPGS